MECVPVHVTKKSNILCPFNSILVLTDSWEKYLGLYLAKFATLLISREHAAQLPYQQLHTVLQWRSGRTDYRQPHSLWAENWKPPYICRDVWCSNSLWVCTRELTKRFDFLLISNQMKLLQVQAYCSCLSPVWKSKDLLKWWAWEHDSCMWKLHKGFWVMENHMTWPITGSIPEKERRIFFKISG